MPSLKAIIFDVDGTIANTEEGHRKAFNMAFSDAGINWFWDRDMYGNLLKVTGGKERIKYFIEAFQPLYPDTNELPEWIDKLHIQKTDYFIELLNEGNISLRNGVHRLLTEIHDAKIPMAIATTSSLKSVTTLLDTSLSPGVKSWFNIIGTGESVLSKKPAPDIYYFVLDQLGISAEDCVVIEDSENGLKSATTAGLKTVITINNYTRNQNFNQAELVLNQLGEPAKPCSILQGKNVSKNFLDLEWLQLLFKK